MRMLVILLFVETLLQAPGRAEPASRDAVLAALSACARSAFTVEDWRRLGAAALATLEEVSKDETRPLLVRANALAAVGAIGSARALVVLSGVLGDASSPAVLQASAFEAFAGAFGESHAREVLETGARLSRAADWRLRLASVRALSQLRHPAARKILSAQLPLETDVTVRSALDRVITAGPAR